ncbi:MAG: hypothetical protein JXO51_10275 [Candidatus Aminicenantes bacterium]|nr:hypothetical protein [Candidatus Aminicenantes bacterium]
MESAWSETLEVIISEGGGDHYNSPASRLILTEVNWSSTWQSQVQVTDVTGGSVVQVYYNTGTDRRGPFSLWNNGTGAAGSSVSFANIVSTIDSLDPDPFAYGSTNGALELITQDESHLIQAAVRTYNGGNSRTFPALTDCVTNTAALSRELVIPNLSNDADYRPSVALFNTGTCSMTLEVKIWGSDGTQIGSTMTRTLAGYEMSVLASELRQDTYSNATVTVDVTSGTGRVLASGQTAHRTSSDPAAHVAVQGLGSFANSPGDHLVLTEVNWSSSWQSQVQITEMTSGSVVQVYYNTGTNRRGPFTLWDNSMAASWGSSVSFSNILATIDALDPDPFTYGSTNGSLELLTQDGSHRIQAAVRTYNGGYSRTFPALGVNAANTAGPGRKMMIPNLSNDADYRPSVVLFNTGSGSVTVAVKIIGSNGAQIGTTTTRTLAAHEMSVVASELRQDTYSNATVTVEVTVGSDSVLASGQTAHRMTGDPAAHLAVQAE